jgi:hypothetical protein
VKSSNLRRGLLVLAGSFGLLVGVASMQGTALAAPSKTCAVHSLNSFTLQGEETTAATGADIVEVECDPTVYGTGSLIRLTANQVYQRCKGDLTWCVPNPGLDLDRLVTDDPLAVVPGPGVEVALDADGNATVALLAGPGCQAGESLITAHMLEEPFESFTTSFELLPPESTAPGVYALPASEVEEDLSSAVATIIQAEFADGSEKDVHIDAEELYSRCRLDPHLIWIREDRTVAEGPEISDVALDNDGNAFVIAIGASSCAEGPSLIEADLEAKPYTSYSTEFTIGDPRPTN